MYPVRISRSVEQIPANRTRTIASPSPATGSGWAPTHSSFEPSKWRARISVGERGSSRRPVGAGTGEGAAPPAGRREDEGPRIVLEHPAGEVAPCPGAQAGGPDSEAGPGRRGQDPPQGGGE